jgi:hypothetical protein
MLIERSAPDSAKKAFLKSLQWPDDDGGGPGDGNQPEAPIMTLPIFVLGLRQLASGIVARGAKQAGWQFLTIDPKGVITSGEAPVAGSSAERAAITRSQGPSWIKAFSAYGDAKKLGQLIDNDYEPRTLRIPGLRIEAFWLRRKLGDDSSEQLDADLVVPFHTFNPDLLAQQVFSMKNFLAIVQPLAGRQMKSPSPSD